MDDISELLWCPADVVGLVEPPCPQIGDAVAGLVGAGVSRRLPSEGGPLPRRRIPPLPPPELPHLGGQGVVDLGGALGEHLQQLPADAGDLGLPVHDRLPLHPIAVGELGPQDRLVQAAQHPLVALQVAGVQRQPAAIIDLDLGRDDRMGVELRVIGPRRGLPERRHRQSQCVRVQASPVGPDPRRRPVALDMLERRLNGDVMGGQQARVAGERPPDAHRLGGRERGVEPGHRPHRLAVRRRPVA
jgi:hypothetical protein